MGATLRADRGGAARRPHDFIPLKSTGGTVKIIYYQKTEKIHFAKLYHPFAEISCSNMEYHYLNTKITAFSFKKANL